MSKDKRYFITPFRLRNPNFWRAIDMLLAVNPGAPIFAPNKTTDWIPKNWHKISPENLLLCLEQDAVEWNYIDWNKQVKEANVLYRFFMREPKAEKYRSNILAHLGMEEEILTTFIVNTLPTLEAGGGYGDGYSFNTCARNILINKSLKTYQYEATFKAMKKARAVAHYLSELASVNLKIVPDYIFKILLRTATRYKIKETGFGDQTTVALVKEGIRRQMIEYNDEYPETVKSEEGPSLKELANKRLALEQIEVKAKAQPVQEGKTVVVNLDDL